MENDGWTAFQVDSAVTWFGRWIEGKLNELDDKGKPVHKIEDLLADTVIKGTIKNLASSASHIEGGFKVRRVKG